MRREFADELYEQMGNDTNIMLLVGDLGYKVFDKHFETYPDRCINCGAAEQSMLDVAVGLTYSGKKVFCYTITPFYYRAFETIRTYLVHEQLPIVLIGSGRDNDYIHDGYSHDASDIRSILTALGGITMFFPESTLAIPMIMKSSLKSSAPVFISLKK